MHLCKPQLMTPRSLGCTAGAQPKLHVVTFVPVPGLGLSSRLRTRGRSPAVSHCRNPSGSWAEVLVGGHDAHMRWCRGGENIILSVAGGRLGVDHGESHDCYFHCLVDSMSEPRSGSCFLDGGNVQVIEPPLVAKTGRPRPVGG
jgi:hypothetical protein